MRRVRGTRATWQSGPPFNRRHVVFFSLTNWTFGPWYSEKSKSFGFDFGPVEYVYNPRGVRRSA